MGGRTTVVQSRKVRIPRISLHSRHLQKMLATLKKFYGSERVRTGLRLTFMAKPRFGKPRALNHSTQDRPWSSPVEHPTPPALSLPKGNTNNLKLITSDRSLDLGTYLDLIAWIFSLPCPSSSQLMSNSH